MVAPAVRKYNAATNHARLNMCLIIADSRLQSTKIFLANRYSTARDTRRSFRDRTAASSALLNEMEQQSVEVSDHRGTGLPERMDLLHDPYALAPQTLDMQV